MSDPAQLQPRDEHNLELERNVRPPDWRNPTPTARYNLVVIGAGTAGLVTAAGAAGVGAKVALIERELMGGDCLNVGCVPSKALISAARVVRGTRSAPNFGVATHGVEVDFPAVMERMRQLRARISTNDSAARFRQMGVDVYFGQGSFLSPRRVQVGKAVLEFKKAVIATGGRASAPPIPGLKQVPYLTNESIFSLTELPKRLGVIGAGPIGCELAQAFALFGSEVVLVESLHGVLPKEDREAGRIVQESLQADGVRVLCCSRSMAVEKDRDGVRLTLESHGHTRREVVDSLLVAAGRSPNVEDLGLEKAGVRKDPSAGIEVNDRLRTSNPRIYAAGDVCSPYKFTHAADFMARIVIQNALFLGRARVSRLTIPWCTYTNPEVARVGVSQADAEAAGGEIDTLVQDLAEVDRAVLEAEDTGFVKIHVRRGTDRIVGATIVAERAGEMISEIALAMTNGVGLKGIAKTIHPYPTQNEAIRKLGDQYNRTRLTPLVRSLFEKWLSWTR